MKIRNWIIFKAWVDMVTGLGFLLFPTQAIIIWGAETDPTAIAFARFFGQVMFLLGLLLWMLRNVHEARVHIAVASAVLVGDTVGLIITIRETLAGNINALGWGIAVLFLVLVLGFGYILLKTPEPVTTP